MPLFFPVTIKMIFMNPQFAPFTPDAFQEATGLNAEENEAIYIRWVNTQLNYASFHQLQEMNATLKEIVKIIGAPHVENGYFPFSLVMQKL
jgi:hypothetical protein